MVLTMNSNSKIQIEKDRGKSVRRKKRSDLRSMLGPTWSSEELSCFYEAYRKYGTDWLKVGAEMNEVRTNDMLETLYSMNKAYLSLQEGIATARGFIAIVVDRCKFLEESDGDEETNGAKEGSLAKLEKQQYEKQRQSQKHNSTANGKVHKPRCDDDNDEEKTRNYSQGPESREQIVKKIITNKGIAECSSKPKYNTRGGSVNDPKRRKKLNREDDRVAEEVNNSRRSHGFQDSNPENNKLRKLLQEDERVGIACEALLNLSIGIQ